MKILKLMVPMVLMLSCGSNTSITNSWKASNATGKTLNKVLVLGLMTEKNLSLRQQIEQQLANALSSEGYNTISAYAAYGPKAFVGLKEQQVLRRLKNRGVDGVITVSLLDKTKEQNYVPGSVSYYPAAVRYNRFWGYYSTYYNRIYEPGYYTTSTNYFLETNLYNVTNNQLLYSAQSQTFDPSSAQSLAADYSKAIVKDMKQKQLIDKAQRVNKTRQSRRSHLCTWNFLIVYSPNFSIANCAAIWLASFLL